MRSPPPALENGLLRRLASDANLTRSNVKVPKCSSEVASVASSRKPLSPRVAAEMLGELSTDAPWGHRQFAEQTRSEQALFLRDRELKRGGRHQRLEKVANSERLLRDDDDEELAPLPNNVRLGRAGQPRRADNVAAKTASKPTPHKQKASEVSPEAQIYEENSIEECFDRGERRLQKYIAETKNSKKTRDHLFGVLESICKGYDTTNAAPDTTRRPNRANRAVATVMAVRNLAAKDGSTEQASMSSTRKQNKRVSSPAASPSSSRHPLRSDFDPNRAQRLNEERKMAALNAKLAKDRRAEMHLQDQRLQRDASISERRAREDGRRVEIINRRDRRMEERRKDFVAQAEEADSNCRRRMRELAEQRELGWQEKRKNRELQMENFKERQIAKGCMENIMHAAANLRRNRKDLTTPDETPESTPRESRTTMAAKKFSLPGLKKQPAKVDDELGKTLEWFSVDAYRREWGAKAAPGRRSSKDTDVAALPPGLRASIREKCEVDQNHQDQMLKDANSSQLEAYGYDVDFDRHIANRAKREAKASAPNEYSISPAGTHGSFCGRTWRGGHRFVQPESETSASPPKKKKGKRKASLLNLSTSAALQSTSGFSEDGSDAEGTSLVD